MRADWLTLTNGLLALMNLALYFDNGEWYSAFAAIFCGAIFVVNIWSAVRTLERRLP